MAGGGGAGATGFYAGFISFFMPETKRLTLEEMDTTFWGEGAALKDQETTREINHEIGLAALFERDQRVSSDGVVVRDEKGATKV